MTIDVRSAELAWLFPAGDGTERPRHHMNHDTWTSFQLSLVMLTETRKVRNLSESGYAFMSDRESHAAVEYRYDGGLADLQCSVWVSLTGSECSLQYRDVCIADFPRIERMRKATQTIGRKLAKLSRRFGNVPGDGDVASSGVFARFTDALGVKHCVIPQGASTGWSHDDNAYRIIAAVDCWYELKQRMANVRSYLQAHSETVSPLSA
jgi:hypothetical protein